MRGSAITALLCALPLTASSAPNTETLDLGVVWRATDNISQAFDDKQTETAQVLRVDLTQRAHRRRFDGTGVDLEAGFGAESVFDFDDVDRVDASLRGRWTFLPGSGYGQPFLAAELGVTGLLHRDSRIRDGGIVEFALLSGTRLTDRIDLLGGYVARARAPRHEDVFETRRHRLFLQAEHVVDLQRRLWLRLGVGDGDLVASDVPTPAVSNVARARTPDDAFGAGRIAYRVDAVDYEVAAGFAWQPHETVGLEFGVTQRWIEADGGHEYEVLEASASALWRLR